MLLWANSQHWMLTRGAWDNELEFTCGPSKYHSSRLIQLSFCLDLTMTMDYDSQPYWIWCDAHDFQSNICHHVMLISSFDTIFLYKTVQLPLCKKIPLIRCNAIGPFNLSHLFYMAGWQVCYKRFMKSTPMYTIPYEICALRKI